MARVEIFQPKTDAYARKVARQRVRLLTETVTREAKYIARRYTGNTVAPPPTGELARSIRGTVSTVGVHEVLGRVGARDRKGLVVHSGAKPHLIRPKGKKPMVFFWKLKGRKIVTHATIHHPGMEGKFYLTEPLKIEGRRLGFKVILTPHVDRLYR